MILFRAGGLCAIALSLSITIPAFAQAPSAVSGTDASTNQLAAAAVAPPPNPAAPAPSNAAAPSPSDAAAPAAPDAAAPTAANGAAQPPVPFVAPPPDPSTTFVNTPPVIPASTTGGLQIQGMPGESVPWSIIILLTVLTLIPTMRMCVTPFARLLIVFHFLRQALGLQTTPSNQTLIGLSLVLTFFLMQPIAVQIYQESIIPVQSGQITAMEALSRGEVPLRKFMSHYVREKDVALFIELAKEPRPNSTDDLSMRVLLPAYILSELKAGFQIGTVLFLPFLIVDMVVASITTSVGMLQLPPVVISTPLKLLLFLMVDGWHLLISSLMRSFS